MKSEAYKTSKSQNGSLFKLLSLGLVSTLVLSVAACGKKKSSDEEDEATSATASTGGGSSAPTYGVEANDGPAVVVTGSLALGSLSLAGSQSVLMFKTVGGKSNVAPTEVPMDAAGKFTATIQKSEADIAILKAQMLISRDGRDWEAISAAVARIDGSIMSAAELQAMPEADIQEGVSSLADSAEKKGTIMLLVAYDKSGNKESEASSFRFIGMPTAAGGKLTALVSESIKGNLSLGSIKGNGANPVAELPASASAFNMSEASIEALAGMGDALKSVKNAHMNSDWTSEPFYSWLQTPASGTGIASATDQYPDVNQSVYSGYGVYLFPRHNLTASFTLDEICGTTPTKPVIFTPPTAVNMGYGNSIISYTSFSGANSSLSTQGSNRICQGGDNFYAREDLRNGQLSYVMNFGAGGSIQDVPAGLWRFTIGGTEVGRFDLNASSPIRDGKSMAPLMSAKFITTGSQVTGVSVKFYRWNGTSYALMTDLKPIQKLVSEVSSSVTRTSDNGEERIEELTLSADGMSYEGTFESPVATSDVNAFSASYRIGDNNYRVEYR